MAQYDDVSPINAPPPGYTIESPLTHEVIIESWKPSDFIISVENSNGSQPQRPRRSCRVDGDTACNLCAIVYSVLMLMAMYGSLIYGLVVLTQKHIQCHSTYNVGCQQQAFLATYPHACTCRITRMNVSSIDSYERTVDFTMQCPSPTPREFTLVKKHLLEMDTHPEILTMANQTCFTNLTRLDWENAIFFTTPASTAKKPFHYFRQCDCSQWYDIGIAVIVIVLVIIFGCGVGMFTGVNM